MSNPNLSELITTTLYNRQKEIADNVSESTALLKRLSSKGNIKPVSGGREILQPLDYAANGNFTYYSGYEVVPIAPQDVLTSANYSFKQAAVAVSISGLEYDVQNTGKEQIIDLLEARIKNAMRTMTNNLSDGLYSDGTGYSGKEIDGLQKQVADNPTTGTVGGIDRSSYSFWRNVYYDATTDGGAAASSSNIQTYMNSVYNQLVRGNDAPDLIVSDNNYYSFYEASLQAQQRFTSSSMADLGFQALKYRNADVILDGGKGGDCPTNHMYFLNTNYLFWRPAANRNMKPLDGDRVSVNQDAMVKLIVWAGNLTASNLSLQGVLKD